MLKPEESAAGGSQPTEQTPSRDEVSQAALNDEQAHLDKVHRNLDEKIDELRARTGAEQAKQTHVQLAQEQGMLAAHNRQMLRNLEAVTGKLCFGRIDLLDGSSYRLGRIGVTDGGDERLLLDWRAPVAASFYQASSVNPSGLRRRRHLRTTGREVVKVSDDVFDETLLDQSVLSEDGSLMAALNAERTGRMGDIVATIQAHQDKVMRSSHEGLLVIDGAPGTGKTVVALHRAAYLLFNRREQLERRGVLIIGPNSQFLRYIDEVLPSLGESHVVLSTIGDLVPGYQATVRDNAATAELKADTRMAALIDAAVQNRIRIPANGVTINHDGDLLTLTGGQLRSAVRYAKDDDNGYNAGRVPFLQKLLDALVDQLTELRGYPTEDPFARHDLLEELRSSAVVRKTLNLMWMPMSPQKLLVDLVTRQGALAAAAQGLLTEAEKQLLTQCAGSWAAGEWTVDDIPLIDEAAELLGDLPLRNVRSYADAEDSSTDDDSYDGLLDLTVAERAAADRDWVYGHLVVDEAQELSPMAWKMLLRRIPMRSITVVGDLAQRTTPGAITAWEEITATVTKSTVETLDVNYRTPAAVMDLATSMMTAAGGPHREITSVRDIAGAVNVVQSSEALQTLLSNPPSRGNGAVIVAEFDTRTGSTFDGLNGSWRVIDAASAKGLEFDEVVVYDPQVILERCGRTGLYVALTRPTTTLHLFSPAGTYPAGFENHDR